MEHCRLPDTDAHTVQYCTVLYRTLARHVRGMGVHRELVDVVGVVGKDEVEEQGREAADGEPRGEHNDERVAEACRGTKGGREPGQRDTVTQ